MFLKKEETMRKIRKRNVAESAHRIIVFQTQELDICFVFTVSVVWDLYSLGPLKPSLPHVI